MIRKPIHRLLFVLVLLVPLQLLLQEGAILFSQPWSVRFMLLLLGGTLDLVFVVDFVVRLYLSMIRRHGIEYLGQGRGWADFLSSVPVFMFVSGPVLFGIFAGGSVPFGSGEFVHPLLTARLLQSLYLLRLLRLWKLFPPVTAQISDMRMRHIGRLVGLFLCATLVAAFALTLSILPQHKIQPHAATLTAPSEIARNIADVARAASGSDDDRAAFLRSSAVVRQLVEANPAILVLRLSGRSSYTQMSNERYSADFGPGDYLYGVSGEYAVFVDVRGFHATSAGTRAQVVLVVILGVFLIGGVYSKHFASTVRDPLRTVHRGLADPSYTLAVHIPRHYAQDEVFRVAERYNTDILKDKDGL
ncbi:MAG: hypothetical protein ABR590_06800 [Spirochaetia bacterium]